MVLDPFCGCGTAIHAAQQLGRKWIGIDITFLATNLIKTRLLDAFGTAVSFKEVGEPESLQDAKALAERDRYQFQWWALGRVGARTAQIGVLITLEPPTQPMRAEAAEVGVYESPWGKHPRCQILTVEDIFDGRGVDYPPARQTNVTFKRAPKAKRKGGKQLRLGDKPGDE